jgi:hypothetical protein
MLKRDQSYIHSNNSDSIQVELNWVRRKEIIKENFKQLIAYSEQNRFPEMGSLNNHGVDSCKNWAVFLTCFHIGQIEPQLFFEEETINILTREINKGNLQGSSLFSSLREGFKNHSFCKSEKEKILQTLKSWNINKDDLPPIRFIECNNGLLGSAKG